MKRLLLASAAVAGLMLASPAFAAHDHSGPPENPDNADNGSAGTQARWHGDSSPSAGGADNGRAVVPAPADSTPPATTTPATSSPTQLGGDNGGGHHHDHGGDNGGSNGGSNNTAGADNGTGGDHHHDHTGGNNAGGANSPVVTAPTATTPGGTHTGDNGGRGNDGDHRGDRGGDGGDGGRGGDHHDGGGDHRDGGRGWDRDHGGNGLNNGGNNRWTGHNNWRSPRWNDLRRAFNAPRHFHYRGGRYHRPNGWYYQRWNIGAFLPSLFWDRSYWIDDNDYDYYGLDDAPPGTVWVRYGDDALLIDRYTGEIIRVVYGIFY